MKIGSDKLPKLIVTCCILLLSFHSLWSEIVWDSKTFSHRALVSEKVVTAIFPFRVENEAVHIQSIRTSCGCTTTALDKLTYQPGETGSIEVTFNLGSRVGPQRKFVMLKTDDKNEPDVQLSLDVYIPHVLKMEPRFVYWNKGQSEYQEQTLILTTDVSDIDIRIADISSDKDQLQVSWKQLTDSTYEVILKPVIPQGELPFFRAVVAIEIESDQPLKQRKFYAYAFMKSM